jgi:hypothetical protein
VKALPLSGEQGPVGAEVGRGRKGRERRRARIYDHAKGKEVGVASRGERPRTKVRGVAVCVPVDRVAVPLRARALVVANFFYKRNKAIFIRDRALAHHLASSRSKSEAQFDPRFSEAGVKSPLIKKSEAQFLLLHPPPTYNGTG